MFKNIKNNFTLFSQIINIFVLSILLFNIFSTPVIAGNATVSVIIKNTSGQGLPSVPITCTSTAPKVGTELPPAPDINYLTTNGNGIANWSVDGIEGYTYKCFASSATYTVNNVTYYFSSPSPSEAFSLIPGQTQQVNITGTPYNTGSSNNNSNTSTTSEPEIEYAPVSETEISSTFTKEGSETTSFTDMTLEDSKTVSELTIDDAEFGKIKYLEDKDLSDDKFLSIFEDLDNYFNFMTGKVTVDTQDVSEFNSKALVTFYNINLVGNEIKIALDDEYNEEISSSAEYNKETKELSFEVSSFSEYEVMPNMQISLEKDSITIDTYNYTISGTVEDLDSTIEVELNGEKIEENIEIDKNGNFNIELTLKEGDNTINITTTGISGYSESINKNINYTPPTNYIYWIVGGVALCILFLISVITAVFFIIKKKKKSKTKKKI